MAVGPYDLPAGIDSLVESSLKGVPWISANIRDTNNKPLFSPWKIVENNNFKTGIIGLTGNHESENAGYLLLSWQDVLPEIVQTLSPICDFLILLSNMPDAANREIALRFPQIHLIIGADSKTGNRAPSLVYNTIMTQTHTRGKYFGRLQIEWNNVPVWDGPEKREVVKKIIDDAESKSLTDRIAINAKYRNQLVNIDSPDINPVGGTYKSRFIPLNNAIPEDPEAVSILNNLQKDIRNQNRGNAANITDGNKKIQAFAGSDSCVDCHQSQTEFWKTTGHAKAYDTLTLQQQQFNLNCLSCHVTWDLDNGLDNGAPNLLALPPEMQSVGCEMCHGPLPQHPEGEVPSSRISVDTCMRCHTKEMDSTFNYNEMVTKVQCPASETGQDGSDK